MTILERPRRNRKSKAIRAMLRETVLTPSDLVLPLFVQEGSNIATEISTMPGIKRYSVDLLVKLVKEASELGLQAVALFPVVEESKKDSRAKESANPEGLLQRTVHALKSDVPDLCIITDVAMDPYSTDGHDGILENGVILNDPTLEVLAQMAVSQARAGADIVAPSDMMDGRVGAIREALDAEGFSDVGILAYSAKYASSFYGPFREALDSRPREGDKKTYQMDAANSKEAAKEILLDIREGADIIMVKPAMPYLDIIRLASEISKVPVAAYNVSGEYAMIKAAAATGALEESTAVLEMLTGIKRAGADLIFTYFALDALKGVLSVG